MLLHLQAAQPDYTDLSTTFTTLSVVPLQKLSEPAEGTLHVSHSQHADLLPLSAVFYSSVLANVPALLVSLFKSCDASSGVRNLNLTLPPD